jgi:hypothetical protein
MALLSLVSCEGIAGVQKASIFALPFGAREQVSAMVLSATAARSRGQLVWTVPTELDPLLPLFGPEWPRELWTQLERCFPSTEAVAHSLHDDEIESGESDDSEADSKTPTLKMQPPVLLTAQQSEEGTFVCEFSEQPVGALLELVVAVRHRRLVSGRTVAPVKAHECSI